MENIFDLIATIFLFLIFFLVPIIARYLAERNKKNVLKMKQQLHSEHTERKRKRELGRKKHSLLKSAPTHLYEVNTSSKSIGQIKHTDEYSEHKINTYKEMHDIHKEQKSGLSKPKGLAKVLSKKGLKKAILLKEILDLPRGLQNTDRLWDT